MDGRCAVWAAMAWVGLAAAGAGAPASVRYVITDTGVVANGQGDFCRQYRINEAGDVSGFDYIASYTSPRNFVYSAATKTATYFPAGSFGGADINDTGVAVGNDNLGALTFQNGTTTRLPLYNVVAINSSGLILGSSNGAPVVYDHGSIVPLPVSLAAGRPVDISDNGKVLLSVNDGVVVYDYPSGAVTDLSGSVAPSFPQAINNAGQVLTWGQFYSAGLVSQPFADHVAWDVNNAGVVSGSLAGLGAATWANGVVTPVAARIAATSPGWRMWDAMSTNLAGQVVGVGQLSSGQPQRHVVIATPTLFNTIGISSSASPAEHPQVAFGGTTDLTGSASGVVDVTGAPAFGSTPGYPLLLLSLAGADAAFLKSLAADDNLTSSRFTVYSDYSVGASLTDWNQLKAQYGNGWTCALRFGSYNVTAGQPLTFSWDFSLTPSAGVNRTMVVATPEPGVGMGVVAVMLLGSPVRGRGRRRCGRR